MEFLERLAGGSSIGTTILLLCLIAVAGLAIASVKVRGIGVGVTGVLFAGLLFGHFGFEMNHEVLDFVREFGLILFVFTVGLQIGPGFFASLRSQGLALNGLAFAIVAGGAVVTGLFARFFGIPNGFAAGLFSGSTTNTPSLGAAQQMLAGLGADPAASGLPALSYAVTYPLAIAGIIVGMSLIRVIFRIKVPEEQRRYEDSQGSKSEPIRRLSISVENRNLDGMAIRDLPGLRETGVVVSRIRSHDSEEVGTVTANTTIRVGDVLLAVGTRRNLTNFRRIVGSVSAEDLHETKGPVRVQRVIVTRKDVLGKTLRQLALGPTHGVSITRLRRGGVEMTANEDIKLNFGDVLNLVGDDAALAAASAAVGNASKDLDQTNYIPVFFGIALGLIAGGLPIALPGLPVPVRLGLAGGSLVLAILLSRIGNIGRVVWYMPANVNHALRELGIILFLACVGLKSGGKFAETLLSHDGLLWLACGVGVTMIPLVLTAIFARAVMKLNYMTIIGVMAGSMTDPPALAFANTVAGNQAPAVAYAAVYPLTMLLRITAAQLLVIVLA